MPGSIFVAILLAAFLAGAPASAAPVCMSGDLAGYAGLSEGCSIEGLVFSSFQYFTQSLFGTPIIVPATDVSVTPILEPGRPGFSFAGNWTATQAAADYLIY